MNNSVRVTRKTSGAAMSTTTESRTTRGSRTLTSRSGRRTRTRCLRSPRCPTTHDEHLLILEIGCVAETSPWGLSRALALLHFKALTSTTPGQTNIGQRLETRGQTSETRGTQRTNQTNRGSPSLNRNPTSTRDRMGTRVGTTTATMMTVGTEMGAIKMTGTAPVNSLPDQRRTQRTLVPRTRPLK